MNWQDLNLKHLCWFVDAVTLQGMQHAAKKHGVSPPAVSQAVKRIELIIGYDLLTHRTNKVELTARGLIFFEQAHRAVKAFQKEMSEGV